jgi:hypothetical protein
MKDQIPQYNKGGAALGFDEFAINSVYKPDGANSVANLTGLSYFYAYCLVRRCRMRVTVVNLLATQSTRFCVFPSLTATNPSTYQQASEQRGSVSQDLAPAASGPTRGTVDLEIDIPKFFGIDVTTATPNFIGTTSSSPPTEFWGQIAYITGDGTTVLNCSVDVQLYFDVEWFGPVLAV